MDVFKKPSTTTSGALTSSNQSYTGKRDHSLDGQEQEKCRKTDTGGIHAGVKRVNQGTTKHQAEIPPNINESNNEVPNKTRYSGKDIRYSKMDSRQNDSSLDRGRQSGGTTVQGGSSSQSQSSDQAAQSETQSQDIKGNWKCKQCRAWNVGCTHGCQMCHIQKLKAQLGLPNNPGKY